MHEKRFIVADLDSKGDLQLKADYGYAQLEQVGEASDLIVGFSTMLYRSPMEFEMSQVGNHRNLSFRWFASAPTAGIATLRCQGALISLSLLLSGLNPMSDKLTLDVFQQHLLRGLHDSGTEPAFALRDLEERPLVSTINFAEPQTYEDRLAVALADRCFAAAYFRFHQLA
jgi:hypothetical protein